MTNYYLPYSALVEQLKEIIEESARRVLADPPDAFLRDNVNFFTKSYLVALCTYLEAFLQDVAVSHTEAVGVRIARAGIPNNIVRWSLSPRVQKEKEYEFVDFELSISRKDVEERLSGNPAKTIALFRSIGVNLRANPDFEMAKSVIGTVVDKRNQIVHHNDNAVDLSLHDVLRYADHFLFYMKAIEVSTHNPVAEP